MIKINIIKYGFGKDTVLENIMLNIPENCILGLVGINGAGKSTLLRLMAGIYQADNGSILYDGKSPTDEKTRQDIFFLPDDPYYTAQATCKSIFAMYKAFYPNIDEQIYKDLIQMYQLNETKPIRNFSKGMRRRFYIALALAVKPKYLLLDEAFDGLDPLSRQQFKQSLIKMVEEENMTVVISSHSLRELEDFCDKFALIDNKTVLSSGDISENIEKYCKFQLAFTEDFTNGLFEKLPIVSVNKNGKFAQIVLKGNSDDMRKKLLELNPAVIEELPVDFEEAFINQVSAEHGKEYKHDND